MREITKNKIAIWRWNSATPYIFGGLVILMGLIATASLLILACSYRKRTTSPNSATDEVRTCVELDSKPKIVVITAGDDKPTNFAAPTAITLSFNNHLKLCKCGSQL